MRKRWLKVALLLVVIAVTALGFAGSANADCWFADHSYPVNRDGNSWCEGWNWSNCYYCWNESSGGSCASTAPNCPVPDMRY